MSDGHYHPNPLRVVPPPTGAAHPAARVEVRRSPRRRKTVSAYRDGDKIVVLVPARLSRADEQRLVAELVEKVTRREARLAVTGSRRGDEALMARARQLASRYLQGAAQPVSVRWVTNMSTRWGSCTLADRTIRLSHRVQPMPEWVIDYVLVHELAHLLEPSHGPGFWAWVERYPRTERARGYLEGVAMAAQLPGWSDCGSSGSDAGPASPDRDALPEPSEGDWSLAGGLSVPEAAGPDAPCSG